MMISGQKNSDGKIIETHRKTYCDGCLKIPFTEDILCDGCLNKTKRNFGAEYEKN